MYFHFLKDVYIVYIFFYIFYSSFFYLFLYPFPTKVGSIFSGYLWESITPFFVPKIFACITYLLHNHLWHLAIHPFLFTNMTNREYPGIPIHRNFLHTAVSIRFTTKTAKMVSNVFILLFIIFTFTMFDKFYICT